MNAYFQLFKYEIKTIYRDMLQLYLLLFPFIILLMGIYIIPLGIDALGNNQDAIKYTTLIVIIFLISFGTFLIGAMGSFLLLEHKDEKTISTISVTPLGISGYLKFKIVYIYVFAFISILIVLGGMKMFASDRYIVNGISLFDQLNYWHVITYSLVAALFAPTLSLFQATFAKNKVEGFAIMKLSSMAALVPIIMVLSTFQNGLQYLLGIFPNFWSIKAVLNEIYPIQSNANLPYYGYLGFGVLSSLLILIICYSMFKKKVEY